MKNINAGDKVQIILAKTEYTGILIDSYEKDIILIKLDSGYNIGFRKKDIFDIKLLEKSKQIKENFEIKNDKNKPNIAMIITGGTIASKSNPKTGGVEPLDTAESFFKIYPEIFEKVNVLKIEIPFMKASEDMDYKDWKIIAKLTKEFLNNINIKGVIITHGTDYLHYTSAALSFFIKNLNKPVVLTYSQKSIDRASSDASLNLKCSALAAISDIAEIMLVGHSSTNDDYCLAMPGTKVRKMHTSKRDAFKTINSKPFAKIYTDKIEKIGEYNIRNKNNAELDLKFEEKIALIKVYPGQNPDILDYYLEKEYKGLVIEMPGLGHVPALKSRKSWLKKLKKIQEKGIIVCAVAQTIYGRLNPFVYSNGRAILDTGVIYLEDMLAETALIKLGWVLGHKKWSENKEKIREKMLENICGELNNRLEY